MPVRQVILDTETTGIGHEYGHRIIEIGCLEMIDRQLSGRHFHTYLNPQRAVDDGAFKVHGISTEFLRDKPLFSTILDPFLAFIGDAELIIHNAPFDVGFINAELKRAEWPDSLQQRCQVLDTLVLAKKMHPGQRNSLDALCKRYRVDNSNRQWHGALLDAELLAKVYLAMTGGQTSLFVDAIDNEETDGSHDSVNTLIATSTSESIPTRLTSATPEELARHADFVQFITKAAGVNHFDTATEVTD